MAMDFGAARGHDAGTMKYPRSPYDRQSGLLYFPRMLDKIRMLERGELAQDYHANMGKGFDERCCAFFHVEYGDLAERVRAGLADDEAFAWCCENGRQPSEADVFAWNEFIRKCGWNDKLSERLRARLEGLGMAGRADVQTMFDLIEVDEGRSPGGASAVSA